jgi:cellulose biosynthesis protein BcsQ
MTARVVALASAKGGSGKTVIAATLGSFLAALGYRVALIDTDAATNGLSLFYLKKIVAANPEGATGLFELDGEGAGGFIELDNNLYLLPATYGFKNTETVPIEHFKRSLHAIIAAARQEFDFIILDSQAGSDHFAEVSISPSVSDQVVIVSEYDPSSAAGVERLKALFPASLTYIRTWVLLNKMLPEFVRSFSDFLEVARYASPVPWTADVVRAYARRSLALDMKRGNDYTFAIMQAAKSLFGDVIEDRLSEWLTQHARTVKEPIASELEAVSVRLQEAERGIAMAEVSASFSSDRLFWTSPIFVALIGGVGAAIVAFVPLTLQGNLSWTWITILLALFAVMLGVSVAWIFRYRRTRERSRWAESTESRASLMRLHRERDALANRYKSLQSIADLEPEEILRKGSPTSAI